MEQKRETAPRRAFNDTEKLRDSSWWWYWGIEVVGGAMFGMVGGFGGYFLTPSGASSVWQFAYPAIGGAIGIIFGLVTMFGAIYLWNLCWAPYRQRDKYYKELIQIRNAQVTKPTAKIIAGEPSIDIANWNDLEKNIHIDNFYGANVTFRNISLDVSARNVWSLISFTVPKEKETTLELIGTWNETDDPNIMKNITGDIREVELKPNGLPYTIVFAIKYPGDDCFYAYNSQSTIHKDLRRPEYKLDGKEFEIFITLNGQGIDDFEIFAYKIHNHGKGKGLSIEKSQF
jgi:hypothetical protein